MHLMNISSHWLRKKSVNHDDDDDDDSNDENINRDNND